MNRVVIPRFYLCFININSLNFNATIIISFATFISLRIFYARCEVLRSSVSKES